MALTTKFIKASITGSYVMTAEGGSADTSLISRSVLASSYSFSVSTFLASSSSIFSSVIYTVPSGRTAKIILNPTIYISFVTVASISTSVLYSKSRNTVSVLITPVAWASRSVYHLPDATVSNSLNYQTSIITGSSGSVSILSLSSAGTNRSLDALFTRSTVTDSGYVSLSDNLNSGQYKFFFVDNSLVAEFKEITNFSAYVEMYAPSVITDGRTSYSYSISFIVSQQYSYYLDFMVIEESGS